MLSFWMWLSETAARSTHAARRHPVRFGVFVYFAMLAGIELQMVVRWKAPPLAIAETPFVLALMWTPFVWYLAYLARRLPPS
jgi:hypothetical protein